MRFKRRDFLKASGCFVATAALGGIGSTGCGDDGGGGNPDAGPQAGDYSFPQGIASGDPRESSVVLWTRVVPANDALASVSVVAEVSPMADFSSLVVNETMTISADTDWTLRLLVEGLSAKTRYYYRFRAGVDESTMGRTLTAPAAADTDAVNFAWTSCQDFTAGTYGAWKQMLDDDMAKAEADQIQFVVHLGDFIYETVGSGFQQALDEDLQPITVTTPLGDRVVPDFPDGKTTGSDTYADTLADFRHLYKSYLSDPHLQAARARWPFICVWDDHEFCNDCWQSQGNYTDAASLDEPRQSSKVACNQAWFEYIPAQLTDAPGVSGVTQDAKDFTPTTVTDEMMGDVVDDNNLATESNNVAALGSLTIYRSLRFGAHMELVMTDERSYRSDHAIPEQTTGLSPIFFDPRNALPYDMVETLDQGKTANGGNPPATVESLPNLRTESPVGTMLGKEQKDWFKETMMGSTATWKIWGNEVPLLHALIKVSGAPILIADRAINCDAWDGYPTERNELMQWMRGNDVRNVVAITGDWHAAAASVVMDDHRATTPNAVVAEFIAPGITSNSLFSFFESATRGQPQQLRDLITYDSTSLGGTDKFVENMNLMVLKGPASALKAAETNDLGEADNVADPDANPWISYFDSNAQGYGLMKVGGSQVDAELVIINRPITSESHTNGAGIKRSVKFSVSSQGSGESPAISGPNITGTKPWPLT
jgi:alkaline phosphatase D